MKNTVTLICLLLLCTLSFAAKKVILDQPLLTFPADKQGDYADAFFTWKVVTDTQGSNISYEFYLAQTTTANIVLQQAGIDENFGNDDIIALPSGDDFSIILINPLPSNKTYYWKVAAHNTLGEIAESSWFSFNTGNANIYSPTEPANPSPALAATGIAPRPTLAWKKSTDADGDSVTYNLYFDTAPQPARLVAADLTNNRFQITSPLIGNTTYYWQLIAFDGRGFQTPGPIWRFTTANTPPPVAALVSPTVGETNVDQQVTLKWLPVSDPDQEAVQYEVWYGTTQNPNIFIATTDAELPLQLSGGTTYYWYVITTDSHGAKSVSPTRSFTTRITAGNHEPAAVALSAPADGSNNITPPYLTWAPAADSDGDPIVYNVYLGDGPTTFALVADNLKTTTFKPSALAPAKKYYWYVEALDGKGGVSKTPTWAFTTTADNIGLTNIGVYFRYTHSVDPYEFSSVVLTPAFALDSLSYTAKGRTNVTGAIAFALFYDNAAATVNLDLPPGFTATTNIIYNRGLPVQTARTIYQIEGPFTPGSTTPIAVHLKAGIAELNYTFAIRVNTLPNKPVLVTPVDKQENVSIQPGFTWQDGDDTDGTTIIPRVYIGTSPTSMTPFTAPLNAKNYNYTGKALLNGVKYYWKVTVQDSQGEIVTSDTHTFVTQKQVNFTAPVLTYPRVITTYADTNFDLEWRYDPTKAAKYDVYLDTQTTPAKRASGITDTKYTVQNLANNTTYYWRIVANHPDGTTTQSAIQKFKTKPEGASPTGTFVDARDGQRYQWVELGGRKWMVHNLAYQPNPADGYAGYEYYFDAVSGNKDYFMMDSNPDNLAKYGYLYNWIGAMNGEEAKPVNLPRRGVCPSGWHIPTRDEWNDAYLAANGVAGDAAAGNKTIYFDTWTIAGKQNDWLNASGLSILPSGSKLATVVTKTNQSQFWLAERVNSRAYNVRYNYFTGNNLLLITDDNLIDKVTGSSSVRCVRDINDAPQKPVLVAPTNQSTGIQFAPKLQWSVSTDPEGDAVQYLVYVDTAPTPVKLEADNLTVNSYNLTGLAQNTQYYWKVVARDANGLTSESDVWTFTTQANAANTAPDQPQLLQPANQSTISTRTPTLTWTPLTDGNLSDVLTAEVYLGTAEADMKRVAAGLSVTSYTITTPLMAGLTYYWKVVVNDGNGGVTTSVVNQFSTDNRVPTAPVLLTPPNGTLSTLLRHVLSWTKSTDPDGDRINYTIYLGNNINSMSLYAGGLTATDTLFSDFENPTSTTYYWRVVASDGKGGETSSAVSSFRTYSFLDFSIAVTLLSPSSGATQVDLNPVLSWNGSAGRTYDVYLDEGRGAVLIAKDLTTTSYTVTGLHGSSQLAAHTGYNWQIVAKSSSGGASISEARGFTTRSTAPSKPTLITPLDQATNQSYSPVLKWSKSKDIDADRAFYDVVIEENNIPVKVVASNVLDTTYTVPAYVLKPNTTYYWKIIVRDAFGGKVESDVWRFTTGTAPNTPPSAPSLISPAQYATGVNLSPVLTWGASRDAEGDAIAYDVYLGTSSGTLNKINTASVSGTTYTVSAPVNPHTEYFWKIITVDAKGATVSSVIGSFTTLNRAPLAPVLVSPADNTVLTTTTAVLNWNVATDPDGDALVYDVYLDIVNSPAVKVAQGLTVTSFTTAALNDNIVYYWRVVARDPAGLQTSSTVNTLRGRNLPPPAAVLQSPANNITVSTLNTLLTWLPVVDPDGSEVYYEIIFDEQPAPSRKLATIYNSTSFSTPALVANHTYYWKVITKDKYGEASESAIWTFTYQPGAVNQPPTAPVLLTPADQSTGIEGSVLLTWGVSTDPEGDAITYTVYASKDPAALVQQVAGLTATNFQLTGLNPNETWYWKVTAADDKANIGTSQTWTFSTAAVNYPPTTPALLTPADQSTGIAGTSISLTWTGSTDPDGDAVKYAVYASKDPANLIQQASNLTTTNFLLTGLSANETWYWKVTASDNKSNISTSPTWSFATTVQQPQTYTISGTIRDEKQQRLADVELVGLPGTVRTNTIGFYTFEVPAGWSGVVTPQAPNRTFRPEFVAYNNVAKSYVDNYEALLVNGISETDHTMLSVYPNPTAGSIRVALERKVTTTTWLVIVDARGQEIARQFVTPGSETVLWSGTDASGNRVNNGAYYAQLVEGNRVIAVAKLMVIK